MFLSDLLAVSEKLVYKNSIKAILKRVWAVPETKYWGKSNLPIYAETTSQAKQKLSCIKCYTIWHTTKAWSQLSIKTLSQEIDTDLLALWHTLLPFSLLGIDKIWFKLSVCTAKMYCIIIGPDQKPNWVLVCPYFYQMVLVFVSPTITVGIWSRPQSSFASL